MNKEQKQVFSDLFSLVYKGNKEAIHLSFKLLECAHAWDDQEDEGKVISSHVLFSMLFDIGGSYLWTSAMATNFKSVYIRWQAANALEKDKKELPHAWYLRASMYDLFVQIAETLYGMKWAIQVAPIIYSAYGESLEQFLKEMDNA